MAWWPSENLQATGGNVFVGPMSPQGNIVEYLGLWGSGFTSNSAINADTSFVALPFELQNWTRVERVWGRVGTSTTTSPTLTYQFGIYDEGVWNGSAWVSALQCRTATGLTPASFGNVGTIGNSVTLGPSGAGGGALLAPGVYYFTQQISNATAVGATVVPGATTVGKNRVMGVREAAFAGGAMPSSLTWRAPGSMTSTWNPVSNFLVVGTAVT